MCKEMELAAEARLAVLEASDKLHNWFAKLEHVLVGQACRPVSERPELIVTTIQCARLPGWQ